MLLLLLACASRHPLDGAKDSARPPGHRDSAPVGDSRANGDSAEGDSVTGDAGTSWPGDVPLGLGECLVTLTFDHGTDGDADWLYYYHYDGDALLTHVDGDSGAEGVLDSLMSYHYAELLLQKRDWDGNRDGALEAATLYRYDALRQLSEMGQDDGADGLEDTVTRYGWRSGLLDTEEVVRDGVTAMVTRFTHDDAGYKVRAEHDTTGDGLGDATTSWVNNTAGLPTLELFDADNDGDPDTSETRVYDEAGNPRVLEKDVDGDGVMDYRSTWSYSCP